MHMPRCATLPRYNAMWGGTRAMWWPPNSGTCYLLSAWSVLVCQKELKEPRNNIVFFFISTNFHKENLRDESRSCKVCLISSLSWLIPVIIPGEGRKIEMFFRVRKLFNYRFNVDSTSLFVSYRFHCARISFRGRRIERRRKDRRSFHR